MILLAPAIVVAKDVVVLCIVGEAKEEQKKNTSKCTQGMNQLIVIVHLFTCKAHSHVHIRCTQKHSTINMFIHAHKH